MHERVIGRVAWGACAVLWLTACANNYATDTDGGAGVGRACSTEADCNPGERCRGGACTAGQCTSDSQCTPLVCNNGACGAGGSCSSDADCAASRHCENGQCVGNPTCESNAECPQDQTCIDNVCTRNADCSSNADCPPNQTCINGRCNRNGTCDDDADCPAGQSCINGECSRNASCTSDADCPAFQECINNTCTNVGACTTDADCPANATCQDGRCVRNPSCNSNADCPADQTCVDNACTRNMACTSDAQCPPDQTCVDGTCNRNRGCSGQADCPSGQVCENMVCVRGTACNDNSDCTASESCVNGVCQPNPGCTTDAQCAANQTCINGTCNNNPGCTSTMDCPMGQACINMTCARFTGMGEIDCPTPPQGVRILDPVSLTATLRNVVAGTYSVRWSVDNVVDTQGNSVPDSVALNNANTLTVNLVPVLPGNYTLRATLTQVNTPDDSCTVAFPVGGPDANFNAQLIMDSAVDVDLHVLHPVGQSVGARDPLTNSAWFYQMNWGPPENYSCLNTPSGVSDCGNLEAMRVMPDCHFANCTTCSVTVPDQGPCASRNLRWDQNVTGSLNEPDGDARPYNYSFIGSTTGVTMDVNPRLDIDNRRGCYTDTNGSRVCTPENISIRNPLPGTYTIAVHYYGSPQLPGVSGSNKRGEPPGAMADFEVEFFCRGSATSPTGGFQRFQCDNIPVNGWCFIADVTWGAAGCTAINSNVSRRF